MLYVRRRVFLKLVEASAAARRPTARRCARGAGGARRRPRAGPMLYLGPRRGLLPRGAAGPFVLGRYFAAEKQSGELRANLSGRLNAGRKDSAWS